MSLTNILNVVTKDVFSQHLKQIESVVGADVLTIVAPIFSGLENIVRDAVEAIKDKKDNLAIILDTGGGVVEVVERMVITVRHHYKHVTFIVPDKAMSAGTIFVMSGDRILMSYFSVLGPIDPQLEKNGQMIPVLSYLDQYEKLKDLDRAGSLTTVEYALLQKLDLAELQWFEQAKELSIDLLKNWLSSYKFKNWVFHSSTGLPVTPQDKEDRAVEVAKSLCDNRKWHSHGRGLSKEVLSNELKLLIEDIASIPSLSDNLATYFTIIRDYMTREDRRIFIQSRGYIL